MAKKRRRRRPLVDFEASRFPTPLVVLLLFITLGFYPSIWFIRRRDFFNSLGTQEKIGAAPFVVLASHVISLLLSFAPGDGVKGFSSIISLFVGLTMLVLTFRAKDMLRQHSAMRDRLVPTSSLATFFFGVCYLQYKINEMADRFVERPEVDTSAFD